MNTQTSRNLAVVSVAVTVFTVSFHKSMQRMLIETYPHRDPKLVRKAFNQMIRDGFTGKLIGNRIDNDFLDELFDQKYYALLNK